jgi:magnesium-transporting ATPase (P-type)
MVKTKIVLLILIAGILLLLVSGIYAQQHGDIETKIEIKISGKVNETQKAQIDYLLNYFDNQNPRLKIDSKIKGGAEKEREKRESKVEKYYFTPITTFALAIIFVLWAVIALKRENKHKINSFNNIFLGLMFLLSGISGILLIYGYEFQDFDLKFWHVVVSLILLFAIIFHIIMHYGVWKSYFKKVF